HLCGGSAGREGVAVQLGATVAHCTGSQIPVFRRIPDAVRILTISGMAAGFSGLFHAPLAAVCFALEVLAVGKLEYRALLPSALSAVAAYLISTALGLETFQVVLPETTIPPLSFQMLLLGIAAGLTGGLFTLLLRLGKQQAAKWLQNPLVRIGVCGVVLAILLYICGNGRYAGLGTNLISLACSGETVYCFDFLCKLLLTVFTLSIGFQGGEVTPLFAIGACLGAVLAPCLGIPTALAAALCYAAVFGSASNTLLAPICIGTEVFGFAYLPYFAVVCTIARLCNGNRSMYGKQTISPLFLTGKE
ncbi:MAG: chloride channel protein, partial [Oscillospiraceae bacterium]|nr:chloride channel protein [Oscillospiraceae bacterium]